MLGWQVLSFVKFLHIIAKKYIYRLSINARLGLKMQIQSFRNLNFTSAKLTPEMLESRAEALENGDMPEFQISPERVADVLDGKLKKTESGRKAVNFLVSCTSFAAAAVSFKKVAPKLRHGIASATSRVAGKFGSLGKKVKSDNINQLADEMTKKSSKIAKNGDGTLLKDITLKLLGEKKGAKVLSGLEGIGIKNGGDIADTTIAVGAAVLAGREAGDIADDTQKEHTLKDALGDITKVISTIPGTEIISEL